MTDYDRPLAPKQIRAVKDENSAREHAALSATLRRERAKQKAVTTSDVLSWRHEGHALMAFVMDASVEIMALARNHGLTAYDASYLALAIRESSALASFDRRLNEAATAEGVVLFA